MVVTSWGIVSLKNFELMSRLYKGLCSGLLCSRHRLLLPCFSNCSCPWFQSRCPLTHTCCYCVTASLTCSAHSPCPSLTQALLLWFWVGVPWSRVSFCAQGLPAAPYLISLFLIGGEKAKRESQKYKWTASRVLWQKGLGNSWGRQNCLWTQLNFRFLLQKTAFSHSATAYFKTKFCSYMQNRSSFFSSFSFTLALSLKMPCAKLSLGYTPVKSTLSIGFIQLEWFIRKVTSNWKKVL